MKGLRRIWAVLGKELMQLRRDRMTFAMVVMIPLIQLMLFGYAINNRVRDLPVAVVDQSQTGLSRAVIQSVTATQVVKVVDGGVDLAEGEAALTEGRVRAVLIIPPDLDDRLARHSVAGLETPGASDQPLSRPLAQWLVDGSDNIVAAAILSLRAMPLPDLIHQMPLRAVPTFEVTLLYNPEQRTAVNIVPGLVGVILTMTMILFTSLAIVREQERGNMEMLITTPIHPLELMVGKIIPYIFVGLLQMSIILVLGRLLFQIPLGGGIVDLLVLTLLFIAASLVLGLLISTLAKSQLQAMQMTVFILLPSILLSGFMFPYEGMPRVAQWIAEALPATHYMRSVRGVLLRQAQLSDLLPDLIWLTAFTLVGLLLASLRFRKSLD